MKIRFGEVEIIEQDNVLLIQGKPISISPKVMAVLVLLVKNKGKTVSKDEIFAEVWPNVVASDATLARVISDLRSALNDSARNPVYIKTVSKKGFQAIAEVSYIDSTNFMKYSPKKYILAMLILTVLFTFWVIYKFNDDLTKTVTTITPLKIEQLLDSPQPIRMPRFNRAGTSLTYLQYSSDLGSEIVTLSLAKQRSRTIAKNATASLNSPLFSGDGQSIYYIESNSGKCHLIKHSLSSNSKKAFIECWPDSQMQYFDLAVNKLIIIEIKQQEDVTRYRRRLYDLESKKVINKVEFSVTESSLMLFPRFSNDASQISFVKSGLTENQQTIVIYHIASDSYRYLSVNANSINQVVWGKNDKTLFFLTADETSAGIWSVNLSSNRQTLIYPGSFIDLDYSPTTNQYLVTDRIGKATLWKKSFSGDNEELNSLNNERKIRVAEVSPNGKQVVFTNYQQGYKALLLKDYLVEQEPRLIASIEQGEINDIQWVNDHSILMISSFEGGYVSSLLDSDGVLLERGRVRCPDNLHSVSISPDKQTFLCSGSTELDKSMLITATRSVVLPIAKITKARFSDRQSIVFSVEDLSAVYLLDLYTNKITKLQLKPSMAIIYKWTVYQGNIYYLSGEASEESLYGIAMENGKTKKLFHLKSSLTNALFSLSVDPTNGNIVKPLLDHRVYRLSLVSSAK